MLTVDRFLHTELVSPYAFKRSIQMQFNDAFNHVVKSEGGYNNRSDDPGGETNFGISKRAYPNENIKGMTAARAKEIYMTDYWMRCRCPDLPEGIRLAVFDCAVNQGVGQASRLLQRSLGLKEDGMLGLATITAAQKKPARELLVDFLGERLEHYANLDKTQFEPGWFRRVIRVALEA